ncbi:DUF2062 domain-containing protein [Marinospirillum alkaliphilum]|uniref:DUF2062 domain-containing protein n=1 Tax=Marinospirillum alkaliphilum DSM 21637 TaxID=1122209 RepID=A0A1K1U727_9GAMM|nr:DUF2062 domain-containing protein [Marinospirillum alkaliphilum]SFX08420.1 hypothetical protein SAMN02745752_00475 [Marinospirillum alkaliphilum DSM 21637]
MPRKFIKRYLPKPEKLRQQKSLGFIASHLGDPGLWTLTRNSVAGAFSIGLFFAFMPMPFQMLPAALLAILFRVNLPISVGMVWISNPITMPAMLYVCYLLGAWMLDMPVHPRPAEGMLDWISAQFTHVWKPLLLGCVVVGATASLLANIAVRLIWRWHVSSLWNRRQYKRLPPPPPKDQ